MPILVAAIPKVAAARNAIEVLSLSLLKGGVQSKVGQWLLSQSVAKAQQYQRLHGPNTRTISAWDLHFPPKIRYL
ncbi:hypothetical protein WJX77_006592 [Trebouxia sp. C0004]